MKAEGIHKIAIVVFKSNISEIRMSKRKFYQEVTDIYATAFDYDKDAKITREFSSLFKTMHWTVHRHTTAELIAERADAEKEYTGLIIWEKVSNGKII